MHQIPAWFSLVLLGIFGIGLIVLSFGFYTIVTAIGKRLIRYFNNLM
jgi:hypothetical protein